MVVGGVGGGGLQFDEILKDNIKMLDRDNSENLLLLLNYISNMYKNYKNYIKFNNNNRNYIKLSYFSQHSPKNVME